MQVYIYIWSKVVCLFCFVLFYHSEIILFSWDYCIGSNFWEFYLIRTGFTLSEPVSLVKMFRLVRLERILLVFRVWTQLVDAQHLIYWQGHCVCDALFCLAEISHTRVLHVTLLVFLKSSQWVGVHRFSLRLFGSTVWKLLIIVPFSRWKLNNWNSKLYWNLGALLVLLESLKQS